MPRYYKRQNKYISHKVVSPELSREEPPFSMRQFGVLGDIKVSSLLCDAGLLKWWIFIIKNSDVNDSVMISVCELERAALG